jgi:hypothetical protein
MNIHPITAVATVALPGDPPIQHGASGSDARLAILLYLAHRPDGATRETLASVTGLDMGIIRRVLATMREDQRIACDRHAGNFWFVPAARAKQPSASLAHQMAQVRGLVVSRGTTAAEGDE